MKTLMCNNCDYSNDVEFILSLICPNCQHRLEVYDDNEDEEIVNAMQKEVDRQNKVYNIEEVTKMHAIQSMESDIKALGHMRTWLAIESLVNPEQRIKMRIIFFKAGGRR